MKIRFEPQTQGEVYRLLKSLDLAIVIDKFFETMRRKLKHDTTKSNDFQRGVDVATKELSSLLDEHDIQLDALYDDTPILTVEEP